MKTYKFSDVQLAKEEQFTFDCLSRAYQTHKIALDTYILAFIAPRVGIDPTKGMIQYDVVKGEFTFIENPPAEMPKSEEQK